MNKRTVVHLHIWKPAFGGVINTTLCGRARHSDDELNNTRKKSEVTCKFCVTALARGEHHHNARWIGWTPDEFKNAETPA